MNRMAERVHKVGAGRKAAENLTPEEALDTARMLLSGEATPLQAGGFLVGMRVKSETVEEMTAFALACREQNCPFEVTLSRPLLDIPVYAGKKRFFHAILPATFLMAAAGQPVFLHGFADVAGRVGVAAVLTAMGIRADLSPEAARRVLHECGAAYLDVAQFNPPLHRFHLWRNELGVRTIFNAVARLANPARANRHLIGIAHPYYFDLTLQVLRQTESKRTLILRGVEGGPEPSLTAKTQGFCMDNASTVACGVEGDPIGLTRVSREEIPGGDAATQAALIRNILTGEISGPPRDWAVLTAAAGLFAAGFCPTLADGRAEAEAQLTSGAGEKKLMQMREYAAIA
jgi:anthranilate phosphoribosyltransferase